MRNDNWCKFRDIRYGNSKYTYCVDEFGDGHRFPISQAKKQKVYYTYQILIDVNKEMLIDVLNNSVFVRYAYRKPKEKYNCISGVRQIENILPGSIKFKGLKNPIKFEKMII